MEEQAIIDGLAEPIMVIGMDYGIELMNRAARQNWAGAASKSEAPLCYEVGHRRDTPCDGVEHPCPLEEVRHSGGPVTVVHQHYQADGELRFVEVLASPLWGEDGSFQGIIESNRDITERRRAQEALEEARARQRLRVDEERERIARKLHDELAQLLGYVTTKAMAVRLHLENGELESASRNLLRLEEAARDLLVDVRQAILDLRVTGQSGTGLAETLRDFTGQFGRLSGLHVELTTDPEVETLSLPPEVELQLLRIAQEALANIRKHASADRALVGLRIRNGRLALTVADDGRGFDRDQVSTTRRPRFGLSTMRERAAAIGAVFDLETKPGVGTRVTIHWPIDEASSAESGQG